jgi:hypothetical protein
MTKTSCGPRNIWPLDFRHIKAAKAIRDKCSHHRRIWERVPDDTVEPSKKGLVEHPDKIGRGDDDAFRVVTFEELKERIQYPTNLANVVACGAGRANGIKLVKKIYSTGLDHRIKDEVKLRRCFAHILGYKAMKLHKH